MTTGTPGTPGAVAELHDVTKHYRHVGLRHNSQAVRAVDGVTLAVAPGGTVGLVGESGSGKSTVARLLLRLIQPTSGQVILDGADITASKGADLRALRRRMQMVFQDPYSSFDPLASVGASAQEALRVHRRGRRAERQQQARELFALVGLSPVLLGRRPAQLSGGQLQRASIARALAATPSLIALDEPVSSLDVSTQAQIINLLRRLQDELHVSYLFISHDLSVVRHISDTVAVMYLGRVVEAGPVGAIWKSPKHPYTQALLSAVFAPSPTRQRTRERIVLHGEIPSPTDPPSGCRFRTRCPWVMDICARVDPPPVLTTDGVTVSCHLYLSEPPPPSSSDDTPSEPYPPSRNQGAPQ